MTPFAPPTSPSVALLSQIICDSSESAHLTPTAEGKCLLRSCLKICLKTAETETSPIYVITDCYATLYYTAIMTTLNTSTPRVLEASGLRRNYNSLIHNNKV